MDDFWDDLLNVWWGKILVSVVMFVLAWAVYSFFTGLETEGAGGRIPWYIALAYYIGGKWTVTSIFAILGLLFGYSGIRQFSSGDE